MHMDFISILLMVLVSLAACYLLRNKSGRDILFMSIVAFTVCAIVFPTKSLDIFTASDISMIFVFYVLASYWLCLNSCIARSQTKRAGLCRVSNLQ